MLQTGKQGLVSVLLKTSNFVLSHRSQSISHFSSGLDLAILMSLQGWHRPSVLCCVVLCSKAEREGQR